MHGGGRWKWGKGIPILSKMLEKQDITIDVLKSVKEDTSQIRQDTAQIKITLSRIEAKVFAN